MQTVIYFKDTNKIHGVVNDVVKIENDSVYGKNSCMRGNDLTKLAFITVDDGTVTESAEGFFPEYVDPAWVDKSDLLPKTQEQELEELKVQNLAMQEAINFLLGL